MILEKEDVIVQPGFIGPKNVGQEFLSDQLRDNWLLKDFYYIELVAVTITATNKLLLSLILRLLLFLITYFLNRFYGQNEVQVNEMF